LTEPLRDRVRDRAAELACAAGVTIEDIAKKHIRTSSPRYLPCAATIPAWSISSRRWKRHCNTAFVAELDLAPVQTMVEF
jgi:hypothetical protein